MDKMRVVQGINDLIDWFRRDYDLTESEKSNFIGTPERVFRLWEETTKTKTEIDIELKAILNTEFPTDDDEPGMIVQGPIEFSSWCPHHLLPVLYTAHVAYIPEVNGRVLGLSKIARAVTVLGQRPILHEALAKEIAEVFHTRIKSQGSAVILTGIHTCMSIRGIKSGAKTSITELRGIFKKGNLEQKFYQSVAQTKSI